jgi:hypothetical protein
MQELKDTITGRKTKIKKTREDFGFIVIAFYKLKK